MKLLRLKINDPAGFRSLPCGFEHHFRTEWNLQDELAKADHFAPFVCAGPNGSGKSNLLEVLAAIFFQLEILRVRRSFLPEALQDETLDLSPISFELDYLIRVLPEYRSSNSPEWAKVHVRKNSGESVRFLWENQSDFGTDINEPFTSSHIDMLLPQYVLGYSSGENEILSLPFFKMRFVQFDEYYNALTQQLPYPGHPETRLAYLDNGFSQAILLCNLLFLDEDSLRPFREDVGIDSLQEFRIIVRRSVGLRPEQLTAFASEDENQNQLPEDIVNSNPALQLHIDEQGLLHYRLNITHLLEGDERSSLMINALQRCATLSYVDEVTDTLILDYRVNEATKQAFRENFDGSPLALFQAFQVLLALNLYVVSDSLKSDLYSSTSHYVSETVPTLASDERIMRFKYFYFRKRGVEKPMLLKELSDGEHQLLHSLGLCVLFRDTNCLLLLDEPETHFNPNWRASFITRLRQCLPDQQDVGQEMLITTHTPFLISDSKPDKVLVFSKDETTGVISISHPDYNTLGASINKITMNTFGKRETIGGYAQTLLEDLRRRFEAGGEDRESLITEIHQQLGDSVEKLLLINAILGQNAQDSEEEQS
ncbi:restriction system-associated AAA family ATPase [Escherichia coli]|uniref:SMC domain-containing protein,Predicted ATP-binding protein involved in virulence,RecF/RecN/SMC N terminal domain n=1 Tax=Escherichia coli TaxID=562 RepID=A0A7I8YZP7_ECOLX|nr:restriction system-associated AAA family ATPase [Escherichia coli]EAB7524527.1 ABC transporter [Escherichia coli]EEW3501226.1 ABC transporter [Escherichia coli]EEZ6919117.1 restriction system-associated AAA family ATPase [Escherichia coli]EFC4522496.1 restriction system-associated AAA family ATPase [Escherichia coli]EFH0944854.1 restriction system-associated AAA family ATPase [Escherichia coli]